MVAVSCFQPLLATQVFGSTVAVVPEVLSFSVTVAQS